MKGQTNKNKSKKGIKVSKIARNNKLKNDTAASHTAHKNIAVDNIAGKNIVRPIVNYTLFEKVIFFLLFIFVLAVPMALVIRMDVMIYVGVIDFIILGSAALIKPGMILEVMRKYDPKFNDKYEKKVTALAIFFRVFGLIFVVVGIGIFKIVVLKS